MTIITIMDYAKTVGGGDIMNNRPLYYENDSSIDVIDFCNMYKLDFTEGNIIKYIVRYKLKNGLQDLKKARDYLDRLIEENE